MGTKDNLKSTILKSGFLNKDIKPIFLLIVLLGIGEAVCILLQMYFISFIAAKIFLDHIAASLLTKYFIVLVVVMVTGALCARLGDYMANMLAFRIKNETAMLLLDKMDRLGGSYGSGIESSYSINLLTDGTQRLESFFAHFLPQVLKCAAIPIIFLLIVVPKDWISGVILFITVPVLLIFMMLIGRFSKMASEKQWQSLQEISGYLHDAMRYLSWLKIWDKAEESIGR